MTTRSDVARVTAQVTRKLGLPPNAPHELHDFVARSVSIATEALDMGADIEQAVKLIAHLPVPPQSGNAMPQSPPGRPHNRVVRPYGSAFGPGWRPGPSPNAGRGLWVVNPPAPRGNTARPAAPTSAMPQADLAELVINAIREGVGQPPIKLKRKGTHR